MSLVEQFKVCAIFKSLNSAITVTLDILQAIYLHPYGKDTFVMTEAVDLPLEAHNVTVITDMDWISYRTQLFLLKLIFCYFLPPECLVFGSSLFCCT